MASEEHDQTQWYTVDIRDTPFTLPVRYQNAQYVGHGSFGAVIRAKDTLTDKSVAIKKMIQPFRTAVHAKRAYRELKLLIHLNHPDAQIVQLYNVFTPAKNQEDFQTLYFVFNAVDFDLHRVIRRNLPFAENHIRQMIYSILRGLKFIHSARIIHRDIKPANIGVNANSDITILDFGLARVASNGFKTGYVATRWWRAPEVFLNWERYDEKLDMWAVGCVMAELILLSPIFPGSDYVNQLEKIFGVIGSPDADTLDELCQPNARDFVLGMGFSPRADFNQLFGIKYDPITNNPISGVSEDGIDLLGRLLTFDHRLRPTAEEALSHPFLHGYGDAASEPTITPIVDDYQDATFSVPQWKGIIWQMIHEFTPPLWATGEVPTAP